MLKLTDGVQSVFHKLVMTSDWLTNKTKTLADLKINAIIHNIGYPDFIMDEELLGAETDGVGASTHLAIDPSIPFLDISAQLHCRGIL